MKVKINAKNKRSNTGLLKFIHITKTAGTSIENIGKDNGILWGKYHTEYGFWHTPFIEKNLPLKKKYDWFLVVRNPYERIISEFYCEWGTPIKIDKNNINIIEFNNIIQNNIKNRQTSVYYGHYLEQYKYVDNRATIHVLKFETLEQEFNNLMKKYNLNIHLTRHDNKSTKKFNINSLSKETIKLINNVYDKDFKMFNYSKI